MKESVKQDESFSLRVVLVVVVLPVAAVVFSGIGTQAIVFYLDSVREEEMEEVVGQREEDLRRKEEDLRRREEDLRGKEEDLRKERAKVFSKSSANDPEVDKPSDNRRNGPLKRLFSQRKK